MQGEGEGMKELRCSTNDEECGKREREKQSLGTECTKLQWVTCLCSWLPAPLQAQSLTICWANSFWCQLVNGIQQRPGKKLGESGSEGIVEKGQGRLACFPPKPLSVHLLTFLSTRG